MKKILSVILCILLGIPIVSCTSKDSSEMKTEDVIFETEGATSFTGTSDNGFDYSASFDKAEAESPKAPAQPTETVPSVTEGRKIIYSSSCNIETKDYDKSIKELTALCNSTGAWIEVSNTFGTADYANRYATYTIRIPVENYREFINSQGKIGTIVSSSENNRDVTESYTDIEARLESASLRESRILAILENAAMLDDVLTLERELSDVRYEIESLTGSLRKYDSLVDYSTVSLYISEVSTYSVKEPQTLSFSERMSKSFSEGLDDVKDSLENFAVFISYNFVGTIIWIIVICAAAIIVVRKLKTIKAKKEKALEKTEEPTENKEDKE